ncbi:MAG TPA: diguanylate cyclase [Solirubrobacteraceae bacterium]|nr:diguanylate cyclase [Solirubrobacteraceae bacterium]
MHRQGLADARAARRGPARDLLLLAFAALAAGTAAQALHALFDVGHPSLDGFIEHGLYTAVEFGAALACGVRVLARREHRLAWGLIAFGLLTWAGGDLVWTLWLNNLENPPDPSIADALYLAWYPAAYVAFILLMRTHHPRAETAMWLDGIVVGLTIAAVGAALVFPAVLDSATGSDAAVIVNLAYPLGDFLLLAFIGLGFTISGLRAGRQWLLLAVGLAISAAADMIYVVQVADGTYVGGRILDVMWPASMAVLALAAWQPEARRVEHRDVTRHTVFLPLAAALGALALLVYGTLHHLTELSVGLAGGALLAAGVRMSLTYFENVRILESQRRYAVTDALTGLGNRRRLNDDLHDAIERAGYGTTATLVFFDLDGFKHYNDTFGHGAGDALLTRLGASLTRAVRSAGAAYRLGGDEFCVLLDGALDREDERIACCVEALTEQGQGFAIAASYGTVTVPEEAATATIALALADKRMYADKGRRGRGSHSQVQGVLMRLLGEREPVLHSHLRDVGALALAVGRHLGLDSEQLDELRRAAELHDIGKLAIPDEILHKQGPLTEQEQVFMEQHTLIGERVLDVAPALSAVAGLVRSTHERWDGTGYPDGLAGEGIPVGARIIAVCDAYVAMLAQRSHSAARSPREALAELHARAGTQFDPKVVSAISEHLGAAGAARSRLARASSRRAGGASGGLVHAPGQEPPLGGVRG